MVASLAVFPFEPDLPFLRLRLRHETADGVEDNPEICVVSALQFLQLSRQVLIGGQEKIGSGLQSCKAMLLWNTRHLLPCPTLQLSAGLLLVETTPLLEKKGNICPQALFLYFNNP